MSISVAFFRFSVATAAAAAAAIAALGLSHPAQAATAPAIIQMMPGTWVCNSNGSNGRRSATYVFQSVSSDTLSYTVRGRIDPNNRGAGVVHYAAKTGEYVFMGAGTRGWGVSRGSASPSATSIHLVDTYPSDPGNGTSDYHFSSTSASSTSHWMKNGKPMMQKGMCTKS